MKDLTPLATAFTALALASLASAQQRPAPVFTGSGPGVLKQRPNLGPGESNWVPQFSRSSGLTTTDLNTLTANDLVDELVGAGVNVSNVSFTGAPVAGGIFSGGTGIVGFERGIVLSSGNVGTIQGPDNLQDGATTENGTPGDADLDALGIGSTEDAASLVLDFDCPNSSTISFQFVFMSEEYNEFVNAGFNDGFALLLNGTNIALVPGAGTPTPVSIDNVNCGNPFGIGPGSNCGLFVNNDCSDIAPNTFPCSNVATEMDGFTTVFSATGTLQPGMNQLKIVIADVGDSSLDSNVLIRGQSLSCAAPAPAFDPPTPCGQTLAVTAGSPVSFTAVAIATNGLPGQTVTIDASGSNAALTGGVFTPSLPTTPAATSTTDYTWTPTTADIGSHTITLTATDQIGQFALCDIEIVVEPTGTIGDQICDPAVPNSTGLPARLWATGSELVASNDVTLQLVDAPANVLALAFNSREENTVLNPGGSMGNLCIFSVAMGRHNALALNTSAAGTGQFVLDLIDLPYEPGFTTTVLAGETWYWQVWYQDNVGGGAFTNTSNFSNAVRVTFQ